MSRTIRLPWAFLRIADFDTGRGFSRGQLLLSRFLEAGRINPSQIRWRSRKQFASLFLSHGASILFFSDREEQLRTSNEPGCRILGVSRWFSWRYLTTISRTPVMCLPCLRLIRVLGTAGLTIRMSPTSSWRMPRACQNFSISFNIFRTCLTIR